MKKIIRIIFAINIFIFFGLGCFSLAVAVFPLIHVFIKKKDRYGVMVSVIHYYWKFLLKVISILKLFEIKKINFNSSETIRGNVIIANHPSFLDVLCLIGIFNHSVCFAKSSLKYNIIFGFIIKKLYLPNDMDVTTLLSRTTQLLKEGYNIIIFPEGTRTPTYRCSREDIHLHRSFAQIALRANAPILPIKIEQSFPFYRKNQAWYDLGDSICTYTFTKCEPIVVKADQDSNLHSEAILLTNRVKDILF